MLTVVRAIRGKLRRQHSSLLVILSAGFQVSGWDTDEWQSWDQDAATARFHAGAYVTRGHEEEAQAAATGHEEAQATATGHEEEAKGADGQLKEWPSTVMELTMTECVGARKKICRGSIPEREDRSESLTHQSDE